MSEIKTNSLRSSDLDQMGQQRPENQILQCMLSIPLKMPSELSYLSDCSIDEVRELEIQIREKVKLYLKCILKNTSFKTHLKRLAINASQMDKMKSRFGMSSCQKDIVKFTIFLKHNQIIESRRYLANIFAKILLGQKEEDL